MNKVYHFLFISLALGLFVGCEKPESNVIVSKPGTGGSTQQPDDTEEIVIPEPLPDAVSYETIYDKISDKGQYWIPEWAPATEQETPVRYFNCVNVAHNSVRNNINESDHKLGLQAHLLAQSVAGLVNSNIDKTFQTAVWLRDEAGMDTYKLSLDYLNLSGISEFGLCNPIELTQKNELQPVVNQYLLVDVRENPESPIYASAQGQDSRTCCQGC